MAAADGLVMKTLKPWIVLGLVFATGVIVGVCGTRVAVQKIVEQAMNRPELVRDRMERELARDLSLTPEQRPRVHEIMLRSHEEIHALRRDVQPRLGLILRRSAREIRDVLNEEQRQKFDRIAKRKALLPPALAKPPAPPERER